MSKEQVEAALNELKNCIATGHAKIDDLTQKILDADDNDRDKIINLNKNKEVMEAMLASMERTMSLFKLKRYKKYV